MTKYFYLLIVSSIIWSCNQEADVPVVEQNEESLAMDYQQQGTIIVAESKKALGANLKAAMGRGGVEEAVGFCNLKALDLTDSLANLYAVEIKRATLKPRNSLNAANVSEAQILSVWQDKLDESQEILPTQFEEEDKVNFYSPIVMESLCVTCHGVKGESLTPEVEKIISSKYPNDAATGYKVGDLRGLWHISFTKPTIQ